jgi:hypothetical protein
MDKWTDLLNWLKENAAWVVAILAVLAFFFKSLLQEWAKQLALATNNIARRYFSGNRFLQRRPLRRYLEVLASKYSTVALPTSMHITLQMRNIYVPLQTIEGTTKGKPVEAHGVIRDNSRVMVVGPPGSGKSMLLRNTVLLHAQDDGNSGQHSSSRPMYGSKAPRRKGLTRSGPALEIPILLELRRMSGSDLTVEQHLVNQLDADGFKHSDNFVARMLELDRLVILLDGLDEVSSADGNRDRVVEEIKNFLGRHKDCRVVITCRTAVYHGEFRDLVKRTFEIAPFTDQLIRRFLHSWPEMKANDVEQLTRSLRDAPRIMSLARNPLLLTIIAYLYTGGRRLPQSRAEFYKKTTDELLDRWHEHRNKFPGPDKQVVLRQLAFRNLTASSMGSDDRLSIDIYEARKQTSEILPSLGREPNEAYAILTEILEVSGLLLLIDGGERYQFAHLTLQEFFASEALSKHPGELLAKFRADPDTWREPVLLWCGSNQDSTELIESIYETDPVMALECLADAQLVNPDLATRILNTFQAQLDSGGDVKHSVTLALGAVAADDRPGGRGRGVFQFLVEKLESTNDLTTRVAAVEALAATNLARAADEIAKYYGELEAARRALVRMGDLAVPALDRLIRIDPQAVLNDLQAIGTPGAAEAILPLLWDDRDFSSGLAKNAAWHLATLVRSPSVESALQESVVGPDQRSVRRLEWVWEPFQPTDSAISIIMGRVAYLISQDDSRSQVGGVIPQIDPRIGLPLTVIDAGPDRSSRFWERLWKVHRGGGGLSVDDDTVETFKELEPVVNSAAMLGSTRISPASYMTRYEIAASLDPRLADSHRVQDLQSRLVKQLARQRLSPKTQFILSCLPRDMQVTALLGMFAESRATKDDWRSIFTPSKYQFRRSWHFGVILVITLSLTLFTLWQLWLAVHRPHSGLSAWLPWVEGVAILAALVVFIGGLVVGEAAPTVLAVVEGGPISTAMLAWIMAEERIWAPSSGRYELGRASVMTKVLRWALIILIIVVWTGLFVVTFPLTVGSLAIIVESSLALQEWSGSWTVVIMFWLAVTVSVGVLVVVGLRRDDKARNPLHGAVATSLADANRSMLD